MNTQNKLYEAAEAVLYGWASRLTRPRSEWNEKLQALADAISAYEQEQPEAIAGENQSALGFIESEYGKTWTNPYFGWSTDDVVDAMSEYASQQTSAKDKEIAELKEAISELIQVKDWKDKYGKDEHYLKAMPIAWENVRKLIQK